MPWGLVLVAKDKNKGSKVNQASEFQDRSLIQNVSTIMDGVELPEKEQGVLGPKSGR